MNGRPPMTNDMPDEQAKHDQMVGEVARIEGTRPCLKCGHDLFGQPILKLEPYSVLITRCPECGTSTPLNEYPVLGRWGQRIGVAAVALYVFSSLIFFLAQLLTYFGFMSILTFEGLRPVARALTIIAQKHQPDFDKDQWQSIDIEWARAADATLINEAFQLRELILYEQLIPLIFLILIAFVFGVFWSGLLLAMKRPWIMLVPVATVILGAIFAWLSLQNVRFDQVKMSANEAANILFGTRLIMIFMATCLISTLTGALTGRSLLRFIAAFILPPRQRIALAPLWRCDGKTPAIRKPWDRR